MAFRTSASRAFSSTASTRAHRALVYTSKGEPSAVLKAVTFPTLPTPASGTLNIRYLLSPVNPADVNTVQGVYPAKPSPAGVQISQAASAEGDIFVGGHEAVAEVTAVGDGVSGFARGDWGECPPQRIRLIIELHFSGHGQGAKRDMGLRGECGR
jgi:mitochondrial enoyl-[acyl-carrier protein] reductase / trans-2-enoyl-CoA reductase